MAPRSPIHLQPLPGECWLQPLVNELNHALERPSIQIKPKNEKKIVKSLKKFNFKAKAFSKQKQKIESALYS